MSSTNDGAPPSRRKPRVGEVTVPDPALTNTLAQRVRREVALERANDEVERASLDGSEARVVVVLGPDGIPQIADVPEDAPETIRIDLPDEAPPAKRRP